jgi:hypothetical protein
MDKKVTRALHQSIRHWFDNLWAVSMAIESDMDCTLMDWGYFNTDEWCPLCRISDAKCHGCIIKKDSGKSKCLNTPWILTPEYWNYPAGGDIEKTGDEIDFLISLLPEKEQQRYLW